jgi:hypothetical protein
MDSCVIHLKQISCQPNDSVAKLSNVTCDVGDVLEPWLTRVSATTMGWIEYSNSFAQWKSVADAVTNDEVPAVAFLEASTVLASIFDMIGGMGLAKSAMMDNINKIKKHFLQEDVQKTLQAGMSEDARPTDVVFKDQDSIAHQLVWLLRGIKFIRSIVTALSEDTNRSMSECVQIGYQNSLKPHHPFAVQMTVKLLFKAAPDRKSFLKKLSDDKDVLEKVKTIVEQVDVAYDVNIRYLVAKGFPVP